MYSELNFVFEKQELKDEFIQKIEFVLGISVGKGNKTISVDNYGGNNIYKDISSNEVFVTDKT